jgi:hypothetical protein
MECFYDAQGMLKCSSSIIKESFQNSSRSADNQSGVRLDNPDNGLFVRWTNAANEGNVGHIFSMCDRKSCKATGCDKAGREGQQCIVSCQCKRCKTNSKTNELEAVKSNYSTDGRIFINGRGARNVNGLYYCGDRFIQTKPCDQGVLDRVGAFNASCPIKQAVSVFSGNVERVKRPGVVVGTEAEMRFSQSRKTPVIATDAEWRK